MSHRRQIRPSDLPTKNVRSPDGQVVRLKVVKADSETLEHDLLAAFRSNVRAIREDRRRRSHHAPDSTAA
jgi:hypothetical protein